MVEELQYVKERFVASIFNFNAFFVLYSFLFTYYIYYLPFYCRFLYLSARGRWQNENFIALRTLLPSQMIIGNWNPAISGVKSSKRQNPSVCLSPSVAFGVIRASVFARQTSWWRCLFGLCTLVSGDERDVFGCRRHAEDLVAVDLALHLR